MSLLHLRWMIVLLSFSVMLPAASVAQAEESISLCRKLKMWFRGQVVEPVDLEQYGLHLDPRWAKKDKDRDVVVMLHGFNSTPDRNAELMIPVRDAGHPCGTFSYPNDHALNESAQLLSEELRYFRRKNPKRKVTILTHSMGGLIARECVENPSLNPGNVTKLIMIAPPNQGTLLAKAAFGTDLWEHAWGGEGSPMKRFKSSITDGMAEAIVDLEPGSEFLTRLNARGRNPQVRYTILLGTAATMRPRDMKTVRYTMNKTCGRIPFAGNCVKRCDNYLADLDEVLVGKGDGIVAVKRGRLKGVEDTVVLEFGHVSVTGPADRRAIERVHEVVLARLEVAKD